MASLRQVACLQGAIESRQGLIGLGQVLHYARISASVQRFIKGGSKPLPGLHHLFLGFLANFLRIFLDQNVSAVAFFAVFVVDQRVVEGINVPTGAPHRGVHKNCGIQSDDVVLHLHHGLPPVGSQVVFEHYSVLTVVIDGAESAIEFARLKNKTVLFGVGNYSFECFFGAQDRHGDLG